MSLKSLLPRHDSFEWKVGHSFLPYQVCWWFGEGGGEGKGLELSLGPLFHTLSLDTLARPGLTRTETHLKQAEVGCGGGRQKHQGG